MSELFNESFVQKLIYVYRINDPAHEGILKVGEASCKGSPFQYIGAEPNSKMLNDAARERIRHQTQTAGVNFELLYTEKTAYEKGSSIVVFQDHEVRKVLERSGIQHKYFDQERKANEWFYTDLETVKKAIAAVKEGRTSLSASEISTGKSPIILRKEQREAIDFAKRKFNKKHSSNKVLWNAKMRFGKTLSALQLVKECDIRRTLILTHRPVVDKGWFEDYEKIFYDRPEFDYGSKQNGSTLKEMEKLATETGTSSYIYFASIQDMRGSELVGGNFAKNEDVFSIDWDLIIIDEAHEGTKTELGKAVLSKCSKTHTKELHLSGTPFNLMDDFKDDEIYTWDYVMEQKAKADWDILHQGDPNPYACLPRMNIFTYDLGKLYPEYADADIAFNFREFFRVDEQGEFIHETNVMQFLDLITKEDAESNYPFSKQEYRENFRHSLWMIPGVKEAKALSKLLQQHPVFGCYEIVNVAGVGDEEVDSTDALKAVEKAMTNHPESTYTITLSCGRLTTGVSVRPWTACFMLSGSYNTAASSYMQTIFRVQTPATIAGKVKEECFVFDFAPDRTLKVIAESVKISRKAGETTGSDRQTLGEFINFCPIIGFEGSAMKAYDTEKMLGQLKKVYVERVVKNGFEDSYLYNDELLHLDSGALKEFDELKAIIGTTKAMAKTGDIDINSLGFTEEEFEQAKKLQKEKRALTPEEEARKQKLLEAKKQRDSAVSILRGISIRMPLLIYGAKLNKELDGTEEAININNFTTIVDDLSWKEFMPNGVTKEKFNQFKKYYDPDIFREAGIRIREMTKAADNLSIEERIERISTIFGTFRNPDKETVLTPWRVVNMHLTDCLGGWRFYDEKYTEPISEPVFVEQNDITKEVYKKNTHILEINSKSGLYALYCAYSVYKNRKKLELGTKATREQEKELWKKVLAENIYVICKTPMAKSITKRTLAGFTEAKVNAHYFEDLVNQLKNKPENFISKVTRASYWKKEGTEMKFDAVVGNPPYQEMDGGAGASAMPVYQHFVKNAEKLNPNYISMIMPARWYAGGKGLDDFRDSMLSNSQLYKLVDFFDSVDLFPTADISGGVCYFLWSKNYKGECIVENHSNLTNSILKRFLLEDELKSFIRFNESVSIIRKIKSKKEKLFYESISSRKPFGLDTKPKNLHKEKKENDCLIHAYPQNGFIDRNEIKQNLEWLDKIKVCISYAYGERGNFPYFVLGKPFIISENECCSETYLVINIFDNVLEASNVVKYIKTKFFRFMVLQKKSTQHATKSVYELVPLQDFTANSDIDWSQSIGDIDKQLYAKYALSAEEVEFIEKMIKPME